MRLASVAAFLGVLGCCLSFGQELPTARRVYLNLPLGTRSEDVFIRYLIITDKGAEGDFISREAGLRQYTFPVASRIGGRPRQANVVVYIPGCQFIIYEIDVGGPEDPTKDIQCEPLATKRISASMPKTEIPTNIYFKKDRRIDVLAELGGDWICGYFLRWRLDIKGIQGGSCLGAPTPLGVVGIIDPANDGSFEINIPDFTQDPTFKEFGPDHYGAILLVLKDRTTGRSLTTLKRIDGDELESFGLKILTTDAEPIAFTVRTPHSER